MEDRQGMPEKPSLRRLLACPECKLQYDVSNLAIGSRFRCTCGQLMAVPQFKSHDARMVRCSSCGGARREHASACHFCGGDFTLHERDLHTICPGCFTRISDRARFCHSCGLAIVPQAAGGSETDYCCPACESHPRLASRKLGNPEIGVLECGGCGGVWLGHELFNHLQAAALQREIASLEAKTEGGALEPPASGGRAYRRCPVCQGHMSRRNFERRSGVILDICPRDGIWLDLGELDRVLRWIRDGGLTRARAAEARRRQESSNPFRRPLDPLEQAGAIVDEEEWRREADTDFVRTVLGIFS